MGESRQSLQEMHRSFIKIWICSFELLSPKEYSEKDCRDRTWMLCWGKKRESVCVCLRVCPRLVIFSVTPQERVVELRPSTRDHAKRNHSGTQTAKSSPAPAAERRNDGTSG